jgi:hypothetical protein
MKQNKAYLTGGKLQTKKSGPRPLRHLVFGLHLLQTVLEFCGVFEHLLSLF